MKYQITKLIININNVSINNIIKITLIFKTKDKYDNEINQDFNKNNMKVAISY